jgi:hypothetical protein
MRRAPLQRDQCYSHDASAPIASNPTGQANWGAGHKQMGAMVCNDLSVAYKSPKKGQITLGANQVRKAAAQRHARCCLGVGR